MTRRATTCALSTLLLLAFAAVPAFGQTAPGDLIITEYMADPDDVSDSDGEYFEIYNDTGSDIDLSNFTFAETDESGTESFSVNNPITDLIVESGTFYVLCKNGDESANGGVTCDDDYDSFSLNNSFSLSQGTQTVTVTDDQNIPTTVFTLEYDDGDNFGDGVSHELMDFQNGRDGTANGPAVGSDYQAASQNIDGEGSDKGSPGSQGTTIPVEFAGAPTARVNGNAVTLFWRTLTETNNAGFHVQHRRPPPDGDSRPEGSDWTTAEKRVEGAGTTQTEQRYDYTVTGLRPGRYVFRRVRQVDTDDDESFSQRVRATVQASSFALQAPRRNPFRGQTTLHYRAPQDLDVEATLYNSLGQQVQPPGGRERAHRRRGGRACRAASTSCASPPRRGARIRGPSRSSGRAFGAGRAAIGVLPSGAGLPFARAGGTACEPEHLLQATCTCPYRRRGCETPGTADFADGASGRATGRAGPRRPGTGQRGGGRRGGSRTGGDARAG